MKTSALIVAAVVCILAALMLANWSGGERYSGSEKLEFTLGAGAEAEVHSTEPMRARFSQCDPFEIGFPNYQRMGGQFTQQSTLGCSQKGEFEIVVELKDAIFNLEKGVGVRVALETPGVIWVKTSIGGWTMIWYVLCMGILIIAAIFCGWNAFTRIRDRVSH